MRESQLAQWFSRSIGFPLVVNAGWRPDKDRRGFMRLLREKLDSQYLPPEQLEAIQLERLVSLLEHAGRQVPYYRDLFREIGFDPRGVRCLADLQALPRLTRQTILAQGRRMLADDAAARGTIPGQTGGTTGLALDFWRDLRCDLHQETAAWMSDMAAGRRLGSRTAYLWGSRLKQTAYQGLLGRLRDWLRNERRYNSAEMPDETLRRHHEAMQANPPDILVAYASGAARMARYLMRQGYEPRYPRVALIPTGEVLEPEMRAAIEEVFAAPIFNRYGSREVGLVAYECSQHAGMHINATNIILECIGPEPAVRPGEVVITHLHNYAMPLIRYGLDDLAMIKLGPCGCGRTTPMLRSVAGRKMVQFVTPAGTPIESWYLIAKLREMANVVEFQMIQEDRRRLRLLVVPGPGCGPDQFAGERAAVAKIMGPDCELTIDFVGRIPRPPSGKLQMLESRIKDEG